MVFAAELSGRCNLRYDGLDVYGWDVTLTGFKFNCIIPTCDLNMPLYDKYIQYSIKYYH